jgi:hypothetical protein
MVLFKHKWLLQIEISNRRKMWKIWIKAELRSFLCRLGLHRKKMHVRRIYELENEDDPIGSGRLAETRLVVCCTGWCGKQYHDFGRIAFLDSQAYISKEDSNV